MLTTKISFDTILPIWQDKLWPNRQSAIEPVSAMTWPFEGSPEPIDMRIFDYKPVFWGVYKDNKLVGVNSGHRTGNTQYRSRGIWVDPDYRGQGIAQRLFTLTEHQALVEGCLLVWSIPRKTALSSYTKFGFETVGGYIETETADANIYVKKFLPY
jgi:GNAT superfamily N-acetyltransferase|tara:strand:+ start:1773 stop:2240 length:468 start_codon:yes stop_codon:yes gene_type:complete